MPKTQDSRLKTQAGFTLVELLIVLVIIGVLTALGLPMYGRVVEKSRQTEAITILGVMRGAQLRYLTDSGSYTSDRAKLDIELPDNDGLGTPGDGKFFDYSLPLSPGDTNLAEATRNNNSRTAGIAGYKLKVNRNGNINCTSLGVGDCVDIP